MRPHVWTTLLLALCLAACGSDDGGPAPGPGPADLSRLVVVGDSLSAGVRSGVIDESTQRDAYPALLARQAGVDLPLPLLAPEALGRLNPDVQAHNLAVPGARARTALAARPDRPVDSLIDLILGLPGLDQGISRSQVEWAEALAPTTVLLWIGNNDLLTAATNADPARMTPLPDVTRDLDEIVSRLSATGASLVVVNLPDVTVIPFLTPAEEAARPIEDAGPRLGVGPGDYLTPEGVARAGRVLAGEAPGPLPAGEVLTAAEVAAVRTQTDAVNAALSERAAAAGAVLVDVRALLDRIDREGLVVGGTRLTTASGGGVFSLDGIHPTETGQAVLANAVVEAINARFGNAIPPVDVAEVIARDPLAPR